LEGTTLIGADAYLFNQLEAAQAPAIRAFLATGNGKRPHLPLLHSHLRPKSKFKDLVRAEITTARAIVLGYAAGPAFGADAQPLDQSLLDRWRRRLAKAPQGRARVLLFSGPDSDLRQLIAAQMFDVIISANPAGFDTLPGTQEKDDEHKLERA